MVYNKSNMDIDINAIRGRSTSNSASSSKVPLIHSNLSFIPYVKRIEAQRNSLTWNQQVVLKKKMEFILLYTLITRLQP